MLLKAIALPASEVRNSRSVVPSMMALSWSFALSELVSLLLFASSVRAKLCEEVRPSVYTHFQIADTFLKLYDTPRAGEKDCMLIAHVYDTLTVAMLSPSCFNSCFPVSAYSACHGMQVTCCPPQLEKEIIPSVQRSFLNKLQSVLDEVFGTTCSRIGRHFSRKYSKASLRAEGDRQLIEFSLPPMQRSMLEGWIGERISTLRVPSLVFFETRHALLNYFRW